jgi:outer membrane protein
MLVAQQALSAQSLPRTVSKPMTLSPLPSTPELLRPTVELDSSRTYTLPELIDFAQSHNPETRIAWERAKQQLDQSGIARAALYPTVAVAALTQQSRARVLFGNVYYRQDLTVVQPSLEVYYTVLDFGARRAGIEAARVGAIASEFTFNDTHRKLIYSVTAAYYRLNSARAQSEAAQATLTNAQTVQEAVEARLRNGLATLPDVLEARAATAQASYELESVRGLQRLAHGQLAESLGLRPTIAISVQPMNPVEMPILTETADAFIQRAVAHRPDLLAQGTKLQAADAAIRSERSRYYPKVTLSGSVQEQYQNGFQPPLPSVSGIAPAWLLRLGADWTAFDGKARYYDLDRARSERRQAESELEGMADRVANEVWVAYTNVQTSLHRQEAAKVLLGAAEQSYNAALEAYRLGVKNFLDVVAAQRALAQARTAQAQSQAEVLTDFAQLAFASGDSVAPGTPGRQP